MYITHITSELAPVAKVGGLADVVYGLSRELLKQGHQVEVILPKYDCIDYSGIEDLRIETQTLHTLYAGQWIQSSVWSGNMGEIKVYLIEPQNTSYYFQRGCFYGAKDDLERFMVFAKTALEFLVKAKKKPDVIHLHDWPTAIIAPLYRDLYLPQGLTTSTSSPCKLVFTIHNMEHQGIVSKHDLENIGVNMGTCFHPNGLQDNFQQDLGNLLKGGIMYSDKVTTVSPNYAFEVQTPEGGRGLDSTIREMHHKFKGILNGVDYGFWNPATDPFLPVNYSSDQFTKKPTKKNPHPIDAKAAIKAHLQERLSMNQADIPMVACIARLVPQKGIDLIRHALFHTLACGGQFILLGSSPIPYIHDEFHALQRKFADHPNVHLQLEHHEELAHLMYAGSDILIVPSLFEPCGLTQMIALRYGTVPVVRKTGGLADTVFDVDYDPLKNERGNGFVFEQADVQGINSALDRALIVRQHDPKRWAEIVKRCMLTDYSWALPTKEYLDLYQS